MTDEVTKEELRRLLKGEKGSAFEHYSDLLPITEIFYTMLVNAKSHSEAGCFDPNTSTSHSTDSESSLSHCNSEKGEGDLLFQKLRQKEL